MVRRALAPGGQVLLCDNADHAHQAANGWPRRDVAAGRDRITRTLADGSTFDIVKRYWRPADLTAELAEAGWACDASETSFAFLYARAVPAGPP
jgi:hypothetical protein